MAADDEFPWVDSTRDKKFQKYFLEVIKDKQKIAKITEIGSLATCVFGRDSRRTQVRCLNPTLSRRHAAICHSKGSLYLVDMGSNNGTFLNKRLIHKLTKQKLKLGDIIEFGKSTRKYVLRTSQKRKQSFSIDENVKRRKIQPKYQQEKEFLLVIDLIFTDENDKEDPELVVFNSVLLETEYLSSCGSMKSLVKPERARITNSFLQKIDVLEAEINVAPTLIDFLREFRKFRDEMNLTPDNCLCITVGDYPLQSLETECDRKNIRFFPAFQYWCNLKTISSGHLEEWKGVRNVIREFGLRHQSSKILNCVEITKHLVEETVVFIPTNRQTSNAFQESTRSALPSFGSNFFQ